MAATNKMSTGSPAPTVIAPVEKPVQFEAPQFGLELIQVDTLVRVSEARSAFGVDGAGLTVAVVDTGLRTTHVDFAGRVVAQRNFTGDNGGNPDDASDGNGHGTNVGGIIVAGKDHLGVAPRAGIAPLKVLGNAGGGSFEAVRDALQWVLEHRGQHHITVVCMSLGDSGNYTDDEAFATDPVRVLVRELRVAKVPVVVAAGNDFFKHDSQPGMSYPAIVRETVSVGAVYDADEGPFSYRSGAQAFSTAPDRITPFSQRLHPSVNPAARTDIFAPGAPTTSSGINGDQGESVQHGTSQAAPVTAGVIMLMQHYHLQRTGILPVVDEIEEWLRAGATRIVDGDDESDNVRHTNLEYLRVDAMSALDAIKRQLQKRLFLTGEPLRRGERRPVVR